MSESMLNELRALDVGTFEIEDLNAIGLNAANMPLSDEVLSLDDGGDLGFTSCCSSCSCGSSTSSCSTSSTCSTCSSCSSC